MPSQAGHRDAVLITAQELVATIDTGKLVLIDVRFRQDPSYDPRAAYLSGHLPGAVAVDFTHELTGTPTASSGKRPLPPLARLQHDARRWGLSSDSQVIVYDDNSNRQAARVWWTLRWAGVASARLLDGGLHAWIAAGGIPVTGVPYPVRGDIVLAEGALADIDADAAASLAVHGLLIDARDEASFRQGHIPGAVNLPTSGNIDPVTGGFKPAEALRHRFQRVGIDGTKPVGVYCGGGVSAAHQIAALASVGIEASLFPGSWSAWSADPTREREVGP